MTTTSTPQVVVDYLLELSEALVGLPADIRTEIIGGVREELAGLSADEAAERIRLMGPASEVAREARDSAGSTEPRRVEAPAYSLVAALLVMLGGLLLPFLGWMAGIAMMWSSRAWTNRQKWIATLVPVGVAIGAVLISTVLGYIEMSFGTYGMFGPRWAAIVAALSGIPAAFAVGAWLLVISRDFRV